MDGAKQHHYFVPYDRVSTGRQAQSGLGIEAHAQRCATTSLPMTAALLQSFRSSYTLTP
jgi:hypothetical protein